MLDYRGNRAMSITAVTGRQEARSIVGPTYIDTPTTLPMYQRTIASPHT